MSKKALPVRFVENMRHMSEEYPGCLDFDEFIRSLYTEPERGIRMNSLKISSAAEGEAILKQLLQEAVEEDPEIVRVPWSDDGYYIPADVFPGKHCFYLAGLFYIQEPSAMLPAHVLDARPGEHVLDLCAAPGGKTVKIAADMKGSGILVSNDINETRTKALVRNVELSGCTNCIVLNETPERIALQMRGYFDKVLLDVPCSGEGMFRRDPEAMDSWEKFGNRACAAMQRDILVHADHLLKPGGILVYSTCTFSTEEDEEMIGWFLEKYPWYDVLPIEKTQGVDSGLSHDDTLRRTARIFPHHARGEGHFCAKLQKRADHGFPVPNRPQDPGFDRFVRKEMRIRRKDQTDKIPTVSRSCPSDSEYEFTPDDFFEAFSEFSRDVLTIECMDSILESCSRYFLSVKGHAYTLPESIPSLDGLKIAKKGFYLGELKKTRKKTIFEPSHSFLLSRNPSEFINKLSFTANDPLLNKYLRGETIPSRVVEAGRYIPVCVQGYPLGWGKGMEGNMVKNLYPQGWRRSQ